MTKEAAAQVFNLVSEVPEVVRDNPSPKPNIMLILMDDVGLDILSQYNTFHTSHLGMVGGATVWGPSTGGFATLKQNGVRFVNAFANPTCSPTRSMLMSGRYASRQGVGSGINQGSGSADQKEYGDVLFSEEPTLAHWLKEAGYRTMMCGKNHLGLPTADMENSGPIYGDYGWTQPTAQLGFDVFRGHFRNLNQDPHPPTTNGMVPGYYNYYWYESDNTASQPGISAGPDEHVTRKQRGQVQNWIKNGAKDDSVGTTEPWFVYWATSASHSPYGNSAGWPNGNNSGCGCPDLAGSPDIDFLNAWVYTAGYDTRWPQPSSWSCIENIAYELAYMKIQLGDDVWDRTVFFLMGDNGTDDIILQSLLNGNSYGGDTYTGIGTGYLGTDYEAMINGTGVNTQQRFKASVFAAGTRVPLIVSGPDYIIRNPNRESYALVDAVDVHATIRRIAQGNFSDAIFDARGIDGVDFFDVLRDADDADTDHRSFGLSERFSPLGTVDTANTHSYTYRELRNDGIWHLIHEDDGTESLYHTMDDEAASFAAIDVNEQNDLSGSEAYIFEDMRANYAERHVAMKNDQWPTT